MKRTNRSFRFVMVVLLVLSLTFPMTFNAYAVEGTEGSSNVSNLSDQNTGGQDDLNSTNPGAVEHSVLHEDPIPADLEIDRVEIVNGGDVQARYRDYITRGAIETDQYFIIMGEDYTPIASMTDARIFKVSTTISYSAVGIENFDEDFEMADLNWTYGGKPFNEWLRYKEIIENEELIDEGFIGDPAISIVTQSAVDIASESSITITAEILFDEFYPEDMYSVNIPYDGYTAVKKEGFHTSKPLPIGTEGSYVYQTLPIGLYELAVSYDENKLAGKDVTLNLYDSFHTWDQIDEEALDLLEKSEEGNMINGRYVSVTSLYTNTADDTERNIWNVVIAEDAQSVTDYLTVTKPMMQNDPEDLKAELSKADAVESGYHKIPLYFNNVHPDETPGSDAILALINTFINGEELSYETQIDCIHFDKGKGYAGYTVEGEKNLTKEVAFTTADILDKFILVFNVTENPYGKANLVRRNEYGFDLNRDAAYQTQPEAIALTKDLVKWDALSMLEFHGYVDELLIEPCTGPHDPNYEYDLYSEKMLSQGNAIGMAMIGNTAYNRYLVPATDWNDGWDDGAPIYGPMFAMLFGTMGYTLEIPYTMEDSKDACYTAGLALAKDCLDNRLKYFRNKLTYKERCINNEDNLDVDQYLIDPYTGEKIGRPRADGQSFFPEYYVIPVDQVNQKNPLEAYKMLQLLVRNGVELEKTTTAVTYDNQSFPAGTYIIDMHQHSRGLVNSLLSEGYDASDFKAIYAELVINHPDMRNFDCTTIFESSVFSGKTNSVDNVAVPPISISGITDQVVIQNDNIDAIKLVNRLLNGEKKVFILTEDFGKAKKGNFVINRADLTGNDDLLVYGSPLTGTPNYIKEIVEPKFAIYGSEGHSKFVLNLLGFTEEEDYVYNPDEITDEFNVIVDFDTGVDVSEILDDDIGYIGIGFYALENILKDNVLPGFDCFIPDYEDYYSYEPYYEGLVNADYSDDSLITANYDRTDAAYVMNGTYITSIPNGGEALITVDNGEGFYKAGWYPDYDDLSGQMLAVSGYANTVTGKSAEPENNKGMPITLFANNIFSKAHAQHTYNMLANALFLMASEIESDTSAKPQIKATPSSQETSVTSLTVNLTFTGDSAGTEGVQVVNPKYKVTASVTEPLYTNEAADWKGSASTAAITLTSNGTYYIHAYAENTNQLSTQLVFGPYNIGTSGGGGSSSSSSRTTATTPPAVTAPAISFTDISGHWAEASIEYVVGKKLFSGVSDTLFAPDATMTRGMLVTVLGRADGLDTNSYNKKSVFTDVPQSAYYAPYVAWAYDNKIASGMGDGLFAPDKPITRGEMATIITNYMKFIGKGTQSTASLNYADAAEIDSWGLEGVQFVTANGLMTGTEGNRFDFDGLSTRAQVATVMERLLKLIVQ